MKTSIKTAVFTVSTIFLAAQTQAQQISSGNILSAEGDLVAEYTLQEPTCFGQSNGRINIHVVDESYKVEWENGSHASELKGLLAGHYTFKLFSGSTTIDYKLALKEPTELTGAIHQVEEGDSYYLNLEIDGGLAPYTHVWNTNATTEDLSEVSKPGLYSVEIMDKNACKTSASIFVNKATKPVSDSEENLKMVVDHTNNLLTVKGGEIQKVLVQHESGLLMPQVGDQIEYGIFKFRLPKKGLYIVTIFENDKVSQKKIYR